MNRVATVIIGDNTDVYDEGEQAQMLDLASTENNIFAIRSRLKTAGMTTEEIQQLIILSPKECEECGEEIPEPRRQAAPGTEHCIDCQTIIDKRLKFNGV
jgi:RNA polymerase-binding transcription factor DksA